MKVWEPVLSTFVADQHEHHPICVGFSQSKVDVTSAQSGGFHIACDDLQPTRRFVVNAGQDRYPLSAELEAIGVVGLATELAEL